jgi:hypothetical protein
VRDSWEKGKFSSKDMNLIKSRFEDSSDHILVLLMHCAKDLLARWRERVSKNEDRSNSSIKPSDCVENEVHELVLKVMEFVQPSEAKLDVDDKDEHYEDDKRWIHNILNWTPCSHCVFVYDISQKKDTSKIPSDEDKESNLENTLHCTDNSHGTAIKVGTDLWMVKMPNQPMQQLCSVDLEDKKKYHIVPPGSDILFMKNKKKNWHHQCRRRKREHATYEEIKVMRRKTDKTRV